MSENETNLIIPKESFVFIPLGGATEIGMNFFLYGYQGKWLIVDCGLGFPDEKFPGVELLLPDPSFIKKHKRDIVGLVITHGHEDHIGAIPYLWQDMQCPIYATPFTAELIEDKLDEAGLLGRATLEVVKPNATIDLKPFQIEFISVNHSIPEPSMLAIRTKEGTVIHTGDWKFDAEPLIGEKTDEQALIELGKQGVLALVSDSTNIFSVPEEHSEKDVRASLTDLFSAYKDRIFVTCFASNVVRLESIYHAAVANGRQVCLMGRSLWRIDSAARSIGYMKDIPEFLTKEEADDVPHNQIVYICTGSQGEPLSALSKLASPKPMPGQLSLGSKDVVIFSSRVIPGNELAISALQKRLMTSGCKIVTERDALVHVSGHPGPDIVQKLYEYLKPQIAIPVHGEPMQVLEHKKRAEEWGAKIAMLVEEGDVLELNDGEPEILGEVPVGCLAVDGKKVVSISAEVLRQRRKMIEAGTVVATVVVDKKGKVLGEAQVSSFGLLDDMPEDKEKLIALIHQNVSEVKDKTKPEMLREAVRLSIRRFITEHYGKKPLIDVHLVQI